MLLAKWLGWLFVKYMIRPNELMFNSTEKVTKLVTTIGSLEIYSMQSVEEFNAGLTPNMYYYTDTRYLTEWKGPFSSVYGAVSHYSAHLKAFKEAIKASTGKEYVEQNPKSNVVMVNFVTKQYVKPENT